MSFPFDQHDLFFDNYIDASCRLNELEEFRQYVGHYLDKEERYFREEAHVDLKIGFLPLFAETFPPILHSSLLISIVILLEMELKGFSEALRRSRNLDLACNDLSGSLIERFGKYVVTIAGIKVLPQAFEWADIIGVFEIRNCLVHNAGSLSHFSRASVIRSFESRHGTPVCKNEQMAITAKTSEIALKVASLFIEGIYESVGGRSKHRRAI